jgi:hypothetical protein
MNKRRIRGKKVKGGADTNSYSEEMTSIKQQPVPNGTK